MQNMFQVPRNTENGDGKRVFLVRIRSCSSLGTCGESPVPAPDPRRTCPTVGTVQKPTLFMSLQPMNQIFRQVLKKLLLATNTDKIETKWHQRKSIFHMF